MPIITPSYPCQNTTFNVTESTLSLMKEEFVRGQVRPVFVLSLDLRCNGKLQEIALKIMSKEEKWDALFEKDNFFKRYTGYVVVQCSAGTADEHRIWYLNFFVASVFDGSKGRKRSCVNVLAAGAGIFSPRFVFLCATCSERRESSMPFRIRQNLMIQIPRKNYSFKVHHATMQYRLFCLTLAHAHANISILVLLWCSLGITEHNTCFVLGIVFDFSKCADPTRKKVELGKQSRRFTDIMHEWPSAKDEWPVVLSYIKRYFVAISLAITILMRAFVFNRKQMPDFFLAGHPKPSKKRSRSGKTHRSSKKKRRREEGIADTLDVLEIGANP